MQKPDSQIAMVSQSRLPNLKSLAQIGLVLKKCSIVYQNLQGSRDIGHAHLYGKIFVRPLGSPHTKPCTKFEITSLSIFEDNMFDRMPKIAGTRDLGDAYF